MYHVVDIASCHADLSTCSQAMFFIGTSMCTLTVLTAARDVGIPIVPHMVIRVGLHSGRTAGSEA